MTIEIPFNVGSTVCYSNAAHIFNSGIIESIEAEIFVKVRDTETGELQVYKPEQLFTKAATIEYVNSVVAKLQALEE